MNSDLTELFSALFIFAGALLTLASAIGLVRFRDILSRMHPAAKPQVLGLVLVIIGAGVRVFPHSDIGMLLIAAIVAVCTAPVIANRVGNVAYHESVEDGTITHEATPVDYNPDNPGTRESTPRE